MNLNSVYHAQGKSAPMNVPLCCFSLRSLDKTLFPLFLLLWLWLWLFILKSRFFSLPFIVTGGRDCVCMCVCAGAILSLVQFLCAMRKCRLPYIPMPVCRTFCILSRHVFKWDQLRHSMTVAIICLCVCVLFQPSYFLSSALHAFIDRKIISETRNQHNYWKICRFKYTAATATTIAAAKTQLNAMSLALASSFSERLLTFHGVSQQNEHCVRYTHMEK